MIIFEHILSPCMASILVWYNGTEKMSLFTNVLKQRYCLVCSDDGTIPCCYSQSGGPNTLQGDSYCYGSQKSLGTSTTYTLDECIELCTVLWFLKVFPSQYSIFRWKGEMLYLYYTVHVTALLGHPPTMNHLQSSKCVQLTEVSWQ